jgi:uncharacterized protein (DUF1697 family)
MTSKHVAFLRGINVGGNRIIKMTDLRACFEELGFTEVSTILQSGNVIFTSDSRAANALRQNIETALTKTFNYPAKAQVYPYATLQSTIREYPFDSSQSDFQHYVVFVGDRAADALWNDAMELDNTVEEVARGKPFIYWRVRKGMSTKSAFAKLLSKASHRDCNTVRNLNTLRKMAGM